MRAVVPSLSLAAMALCSTLTWGDGEVDAQLLPVVLVVEQGESARAAADEIALAVGDLVRARRIAVPGEFGGTLGERIAWIESEILSTRAVAALWIEPSGSKWALVHFLTNDSGVMILRTLGLVGGGVVELDLALLVRETIALSAALAPRTGERLGIGDAPDNVPVVLFLDSGAVLGGAEALRRRAGGAVRIDRILLETGFSEWEIKRQLEMLKGLFSRTRAFGAIWAERDRTGASLIFVAVPGDGTPLIMISRLHEGYRDRADEELWGLAIRMLADRLDATRFSEAADEPDERRAPRVAMSIFGAMAGGLYGGHGESLLGGGGVSLDAGLGRGMFVRISFLATVGPNMERGDENVSAWELEPSIGTGYAWPLGRARVDLFVAIATPRKSAELAVGGEARAQEFTWWRPRWIVGFDLAFPVSRRAALTVQAGLYGAPTNDVFRRESNDEVIWATSFMSWRFGLGVGFGSSRP